MCAMHFCINGLCNRLDTGAILSVYIETPQVASACFNNNYVSFSCFNCLNLYYMWYLWFADVARNSPADIRTVLASYEKKDIAKEFLERSKDYQR